MNNFSRSIKYLFSAAVLAAGMGATPASAALIVDGGLTLDTAPTDFYQQTIAAPCVIGGENCQNPASFPKTLAGSGDNGSDFDKTSPLYTISDYPLLFGAGAFTIGLDYNDTSKDQILYSFEARYYDNNDILVGTQLFNVETDLKTVNNGVGWSDFLLTGFIIPADATTVEFQALWFNNDGPDRYFVIASTAPPCQIGDPGCDVTSPEPASLALFGLAALAAGAVRRRRK